MTAAKPATADQLRRAFTNFFDERGHTVVPSASLIPHDRTLLFTVAGMVPFKPYFVGEETPPYKRATSIQKCVRAGGKHNDLDDIGRTNRHFSFFEMLGHFSFGDYFKAEALPWAWELVTDGLGIDPERLWVTVHESDDEAEQIWRDVVGISSERIQRMGDDNFWRMADTGPCGPSSEIFYDLGPEHGPEGGPAKGGEDRFFEFWNTVFMQYDQQPDGTRVDLPAPSVDCGVGLERTLMLLQGHTSIWEIDLFRPLIETAERASGTRYGKDDESDVSLRILAEHGRTMAFLVTDGVVPSNEERGYVLRRIIRRAVRHAYRLGGSEQPVTPALAQATIDVMGDAYPELVKAHDLVVATVTREEERFRQTLRRGVELLDGKLAAGDITGGDAFFLHDTLGFPVDLTREIAEERGRSIDLDGFDAAMEEQRARAQQAHQEAGGRADAPVGPYKELLDEFGPTGFTGRQEYRTAGARVLALFAGGERVARAVEGDQVDVVLDRTPFYAEAGGQVGDTGIVTTSAGAELRVTDTQYGLPDLVLHRAEIVRGEIEEGDEAAAVIDAERRDRIRRNHTATHVLHWALREVLGSHVKQAGSLVAPDRLRFDFSHHEAVTPEQLDRIEALANEQIITDAPVRHYETTREHAESLGAIAFFGEKYGDLVRVLEAGEQSVELCGGTHVHALGFIGPIKIVSEGSIGSNLRRIEAVTGDGALARIHDQELQLRRASELLKVGPSELSDRVERLLDQVKSLNEELERARGREAVAEAASLAADAADGVVAARRDGLSNEELRRVAVAARDALGSGVVALVGAGSAGDKANVVVAVTKGLVERGISAAEIAAPAAKALGGGTGKNKDLALGGGPNVAAADEALALARKEATDALAGSGD
jgi:alanyl-tRNA synthetase